MADSYTLVVSRGYVRLVHKCGPESLVRRARRRAARWVPDDEFLAEGEDDLQDIPECMYADYEPDIPDWADPDCNPREDGPEEAEGAVRLLTAGRGDDGLSRRSRNNMRRLFNSLPWEMLGARPALITLTYPGEWQRWVPDGRAWDRHRRSLERRWVRRWKEPLVGVWVKEFQESGRPHLHLYVGLPSAMGEEDFAGLRQRTLMRQRLERRLGRYEGRKRLPAIGQEYGGDFAMWLRTAWAEVVGTQGRVQAHHARGADVVVMFWTEEAAEKADRTAVAEYLAREAAKWRQKKPPAGFVGVGHYYGYWGRTVGFVPQEQEVALNPLVAMEMGRRLERWVNWKLHILRRGAAPATSMTQRRSWDGITAFGLRPEQSLRLLHWSEQAAARKVDRQPSWGSGGAAPGEITKLLLSVDVATGEVVSVQEGGGPVQDPGVDGLQVAAHGGGRVAVPEDPLDVEQVEVVGSVLGRGVVEDSSGGAAQIVGSDMAESGLLGPIVDDVEEGAVAGSVVPVQSAGSPLAGSAEDLSADERRRRQGVGVGVQVPAEGVAEESSGGGLAGLASLAGPGDGRQVAQVVNGQGPNLGDAHPEESQSDDDLVA